MKILLKVFSLSIFLPLFTSCASKTLILSAPAISMTDPPKKVANYVDGKPVTSRYCAGDKAISTTDSVVGMIDEVVMIAQRKSKSKYIKDASIYRESKFFGGNCLVLEGTSMN